MTATLELEKPSVKPAPTTCSISHASPAALDLTDEMLMQMIQQRKPDALGHLHDRYASMLKALVMKVLHNDAESDDIIQEIYMEIWNRAESYDPAKGKALGWVITLSRRRAIDRLRKREAYCRAEERLAEESKSMPQDGVAHVDQDVAHAEMRQHLDRVLANLPIAQRQAIELAFYKGMSQREIATSTGIPLGTVKTRLELGLKKISDALVGFEDLL